MSKAFENILHFLQNENIDTFAALRADQLCVTDQKRMPEKAQSAVVFLIPYYTGNHPDRNISLYAVSRDYHLYIKELSAKFTCDNTHRHFFFADTSPVDDRRAAIAAGLGFLGQNGLVINETYGSYFFIGTIITDAVFDDGEYTGIHQKKDCCGCGLCKKSCAFLRGESEYCLSELNQRKNVTPEELRLIHSQKILWGCDACQEACPHNKNVTITPIEFFHKALLEKIDVQMIENMSKDEFSQRAFGWRGKKTILRNLGKEI